MPPLDLTRPRDLADLLRTALEVWSRHLGVLVALTGMVVVPAFLLLEALAGAVSGDGADTAAGALLTLVVVLVVVQAVVTAFCVQVLQAAGRGETPTVAAAARAGVTALPAVLAVLGVYVLGVGAASLLLIVPGVWLGVRWFFGPQATIVEGLGVRAALTRSAALVAGRWWRTFGVLLVLVAVPTVLATMVEEALRAVSDARVAVVVTALVVETLAISFTTLAGALAFFDLRARAQVAPAAGPGPLVHPERPGPQLL